MIDLIKQGNYLERSIGRSGIRVKKKIYSKIFSGLFISMK